MAQAVHHVVVLNLSRSTIDLLEHNLLDTRNMFWETRDMSKYDRTNLLLAGVSPLNSKDENQLSNASCYLWTKQPRLNDNKGAKQCVCTNPSPDLSRMSNVAWFNTFSNLLKGPIPDLSNLTKLTALRMEEKKYHGLNS